VLADLPLDAYVKATDSLVDLGVTPSLGALFGSSPTEDLPALERLMKGSLYDRPRIEPRDLRGFDVKGVLGEITAPTLLLKSKESVYTDMTQTRALLAGIKGAEMMVVEGTMAPWLADRDAVVGALVSFIAGGVYEPASSHRDRLLTIVFTDLVSSTDVIDREGDEAARRAFQEVEGLVSEMAARQQGRLVKNLGDGSLLTFDSTRNALSFALGLQERMASRKIQLRVGMSAGEPIQEGGDVHGTAVVQASRIADLGGAGEVMVSDSVRQLAAGKEFRFESLGEVRLKGFQGEEEVWRASRGERG
jgi:class 3 adenylate cyclase